MLKRQINRQELRTWYAYNQLEPLEPEWNNWRMALLGFQIAQAVVAALGGGRIQAKVSDFRFKYGDEAEEFMSPEEIKSNLMLMFAAHNAKEKEKEKKPIGESKVKR